MHGLDDNFITIFTQMVGALGKALICHYHTGPLPLPDQRIADTIDTAFQAVRKPHEATVPLRQLGVPPLPLYSMP